MVNKQEIEKVLLAADCRPAKWQMTCKVTGFGKYTRSGFEVYECCDGISVVPCFDASDWRLHTPSFLDEYEKVLTEAEITYERGQFSLLLPFSEQERQRWQRERMTDSTRVWLHRVPTSSLVKMMEAIEVGKSCIHIEEFGRVAHLFKADGQPLDALTSLTILCEIEIRAKEVS